jgi:hypothetical protein
MVLARHRPEPGHLPEKPFQGLGLATCIARQKLTGLAGEVDEDRAGFEYGERTAAIRRLVIDDGRNAVVGRDREKLGPELLSLADVHGDDAVRQRGLLEEHGDFVSVRSRPVVQIDHEPILTHGFQLSRALLGVHSCR